MRVLFIHPNFPAQFVNIASALGKESGNTVVFLTARVEGNLPGVHKVLYVKNGEPAAQAHRYIQSVEDAILQGQAAYRAALQLKKEGFVPDVIYGHSGWGPTLYMKDVFPGTPLICYFEWFYRSHGSDCNFDPNEQLLADAECRIRTSNAAMLIDLYSCDQGVSPTNYQYNQFPREYRHKIKVMHDGVNTDYYHPQQGAKLILPQINLDLSDVDELVTYVGRGMEPYRGFPQFMESVEILLKRRPKCQVVIVGADRVTYGCPLPDGQTYKQLMLEKLDIDLNRVHFTGLLPHNMYRQVLQASSVHVYLTRPFVLSWSMLEAMSTGCLVVASNTDPVKEVMQDGVNGLLVDFFDPQQIADKVELAMDNPTHMNEIRVGARETILDVYDLKKILPRQLSLLQDARSAVYAAKIVTQSGNRTKPLVSVITACFNGGKYIQRALESVKMSTYSSIEHIIIDDFSTDNTVTILESLKNKYNFTLIKSVANQGPAVARNLAIAQSRGKYVLPLDCDNYISPDYIETLVNCAESLGGEFSPFYTHIRWFGTKDKEVTNPEWSIERLLQGPYIDSGSMFSRQAFDTVGGFDSNLRQWEDYDLFLAMALHGFKGKLVSGPTLFYNLREDSLSDHYNSSGGIIKKREAQRYIYQKHADKLRQQGWDKYTEVGRHLAEEAKLGELLRILPPDAKVIIDFGCGNGELGSRYIKINPDCEYIGVEQNSEAAQIAGRRLTQVVVASSEYTEGNEVLSNNEGTIDCLIYRDFLEHVNDPWNALKQHVAYLKDDGQVIACIPNIQHWNILFGLLNGKWECQSEGPLDTGHFFTLGRIQAMFAKVGLHIFNIQPRVYSSEQSKKFQEMMSPVVTEIGLDHTTFNTQTAASEYLIRATKQPIVRRLFLQAMLGETKACSRVRIVEANDFISTIPGVRTEAKTQVADLRIARHGEDKVFIWQRTWPRNIEQQRELIRQGYLIIAEIDDDPLRWREYHESNNFFAFRACHGVQTSTQPLAEYLLQLNPNVAVFANQLASLPQTRIYRKDWPVTIFFGALNREQDWLPIMTAINRVLSTYKDKVQVKVIHDKLFFNALQTEYKQFTNFCPYEKYVENLRTADIGLLPLEATRFNTMKSDLKFLECAGNGVTVLASPTVYDQSVQDGVTGYIYRNVDEFESRLRLLIENSSVRRTIAANAYEWVKHNRMLSQHYRQRWQWYVGLFHKLPQLNEELLQRVSGLLR